MVEHWCTGLFEALSVLGQGESLGGHEDVMGLMIHIQIEQSHMDLCLEYMLQVLWGNKQLVEAVGWEVVPLLDWGGKNPAGPIHLHPRNKT